MATSTKIYGLIGYPVKHSLSSFMHNAAFKTLGIDAEYRLFEVKPEKLEGFLLGDIIVGDAQGNKVHAKDVVGFNITIPHKVKAREILEKEFPFDKNAKIMEEDLFYVKLTGAINTVKRNGNKLDYRNTDAWGFLKALKKDLGCFEPKDKKVLLIGCGGAGRAIIASLSWTPGAKKIFINDINDRAINSTEAHFSQLPTKWASILENEVEFILKEDIAKIIKDCDLLVNASPIGMKEGDSSVIDKALLHKGLSIFDLVYNRETQLIKDAKELGLPFVNGLGMLLYQGVAAFEFWTGKKAPIEIMKQELYLHILT